MTPCDVSPCPEAGTVTSPFLVPLCPRHLVMHRRWWREVAQLKRTLRGMTGAVQGWMELDCNTATER